MNVKKGYTPLNGDVWEDIGGLINPNEGEPNAIVRVEFDNESILKVGALGVGLILLANFINN